MQLGAEFWKSQSTIRHQDMQFLTKLCSMHPFMGQITKNYFSWSPVASSCLTNNCMLFPCSFTMTKHAKNKSVKLKWLCSSGNFQLLDSCFGKPCLFQNHACGKYTEWNDVLCPPSAFIPMHASGVLLFCSCLGNENLFRHGSLPDLGLRPNGPWVLLSVLS